MSEVSNTTRPVLEIDREVDAGYLTLREGRVAGTREVTSEVFVDVDADGAVLGIELLGVSGIEIRNV